MNFLKKNKGITLVALIITIIVMLILVMVSIQILFNTGLFESAGKAAQKTNIAKEQEQEFASGDIINKYVSQATCTHEWGEWVEKTRTCTKCGQVHSLVIGATIIGYDPSIGESGIISTSYTSVGAEGDGTIAGGSSGNGYGDQTFTVESITEWQLLGEENGQVIITPRNVIRRCILLSWSGWLYEYDR